MMLAPKLKRLERLLSVMDRTGLSRSTIYRQMDNGTFPRPVKIAGTKLIGWPSDVIDAWIDSQSNPTIGDSK